jgi:hypothetical protein
VVEQLQTNNKRPGPNRMKITISEPPEDKKQARGIYINDSPNPIVIPSGDATLNSCKEPPDADPQVRWCREGGSKARSWLIKNPSSCYPQRGCNLE